MNIMGKYVTATLSRKHFGCSCLQGWVIREAPLRIKCSDGEEHDCVYDDLHVVINPPDRTEASMVILRLHLKTEYFLAIQCGAKVEEYRLASKWRKRLEGKHFDQIHLLKGYPKTGDETRIIRRRWNGYVEKVITAPLFGADPVEVLAICVGVLP